MRLAPRQRDRPKRFAASILDESWGSGEKLEAPFLEVYCLKCSASVNQREPDVAFVGVLATVTIQLQGATMEFALMGSAQLKSIAGRVGVAASGPSFLARAG